jgi:hypothetical protein
MRNAEFRKAEIDAVANLLPEAQKIVKQLKGRKTNTPHDAYFYLASVPAEMLIFVEIELPNPRALSKIRNYIQKWRPIRLALPAAELDALGIPRGPKFDSILEQLFEMQLRGRARTPEDRTKALRNLAGIREEPVKKPEKPKRGKAGEAPATSHQDAAKPGHAPGKGAPVATTAAAATSKGHKTPPTPAPSHGKSKARPTKGSRGR